MNEPSVTPRLAGCADLHLDVHQYPLVNLLAPPWHGREGGGRSITMVSEREKEEMRGSIWSDTNGLAEQN